MTQEIVKTEPGALDFISQPSPEALEAVLAEGRLEKLTTSQRLQFLSALCQSLQINALTSPFEFRNLSGKLSLYAKKDCTDQLRKRDRVSCKILSRERVEDVYVVTAKAILPSGREDESIGAVPIAGLKGGDLANAIMKAETKAKRRVTLSICGLGFVIDESELDTVPHAPVDKVQHIEQRIYETAEATGQPIPASAQPVIELAAEHRKEEKKAEKENWFSIMLATLAVLKAEIGDAEYYRILTDNEIKHSNEITSKAQYKRVWQQLSAIANDKKLAEQNRELDRIAQATE